MVQEQADLSVLTVTSVDHIQEVEQLEEGHIGMDVFDVGLQEGILQRRLGYAQGALALEVGDLILAYPVGQWFHPGRQESQVLIGLIQTVGKELNRVPGDLVGVAETRPLHCFV